MLLRLTAVKAASPQRSPQRKSAIHGLPVTLRILWVNSDKSTDKSDWFWSQSIVFTSPFKTGMSLDLARGRDSWCWPKGARPLGTRMNQNQSWLMRTRFPALCVSYLWFLRVLIGSLNCVCSLRLARVINLLLFLRHSTENRSNYTINRAFSHAHMAAIVVSQNNETPAMVVYQSCES